MANQVRGCAQKQKGWVRFESQDFIWRCGRLLSNEDAWTSWSGGGKMGQRDPHWTAFVLPIYLNMNRCCGALLGQASGQWLRGCGVALLRCQRLAIMVSAHS